MNDNTVANLVRQNTERELSSIFIYLAVGVCEGEGVSFRKIFGSFCSVTLKNITKPPLKQTGLKFNTMACVFTKK